MPHHREPIGLAGDDLEAAQFSFDLGQERVDDAVEKSLLVRYVVIERHRLHAQLGGHPPHRECLDAFAVGKLDRRLEHTVAAERGSALRSIGHHDDTIPYTVRLDSLTLYRYLTAYEGTSEEASMADHVTPEAVGPGDFQDGRQRLRSVLMNAIVQEEYGPPDAMELRRVEVPIPDADQVLIRVAAASLNIYDWHMTTGMPFMARAAAGLTKPKRPIPGADVAGVVEAVGSKVTRFRVGDEVYGDIGSGAFAEYAVGKEGALAHKPAEVTFVQAAAVPLAGLTALQGVRDVGRIQPGHRVIVNGASGGVGTFAIQVAKALGAEVTAVCSATKVDMARSLGADRVIDYSSEDYTRSERGYQMLFDNVGNRPWAEISRVLVPDGIVVSTTGPKLDWFGPLRHLLARKGASLLGSKRFTWFTAHVDAEDLEFLSGLLASGAVTPVIETTYSLADVPEAMQYLSEGHAHGKLAVVP